MKLLRLYTIIFIAISLCQSCTYVNKTIFAFTNSVSKINREESVNKTLLLGDDYRLFQGTPAWELAKAVQDGNKSKIDKILKEQYSLINFQEPQYGNTLLMLTIANQQTNMCKYLLEKGANVSIHDTYNGSSALIDACSFSFYNINIIKLLIEYGANVNDIETGERKKGNTTRKTPLIAASSENIDFVKYLLSHGANINYQNEYGTNALNTSVLLKKYEITYCLLQHGADYERPIYYKKDYSVPLEQWNSEEQGEPMFLKQVIEEDHPSILEYKRYRYRRKILDFLSEKK